MLWCCNIYTYIYIFLAGILVVLANSVFKNLFHFLKCSGAAISIHIYFFSIWFFSWNHSQITGLQEKEEGISITPYYHSHSLHRHLDINRAITTESSPLHIGSRGTRTRNLFYTIRHPALVLDNTLMVRCCTDICLFPSKTCEALFKNREKM